MNSTKSLPIIQGELFDSDKKDDIQALVNSLSGIECDCGILMLSSGFPSFTQTHFPSTVSFKQNVGTTKKSIVRHVNELNIHGRCRTAQ